MLEMGVDIRAAEAVEEGVACDIGSAWAIASYFEQLHDIRRDRLDAEGVLEDLTELVGRSSMKASRFPLSPSSMPPIASV